MTIETKSTSAPKIWRSDQDVSSSAGLPLLTRIATLGASLSCCGRLRADSLEEDACGFAGGSQRQVVSAAEDQRTGRHLAARGVGEGFLGDLAVDPVPQQVQDGPDLRTVPLERDGVPVRRPPVSTPPWSALTVVIGTVAGLNDAPPRGTSRTSAPHRDPWLHAPGGA